MSDRDVVIRVEGLSKLYRLGEVGTGSLAHDVNRWWHKVRGKEDPYLKIGEVNDRTKPAKQTSADGGSQGTNGTTNHTNKHEGEKRGRAWTSQAALLFQIALQASLRGIRKTHRSPAALVTPLPLPADILSFLRMLE